MKRRFRAWNVIAVCVLAVLFSWEAGAELLTDEELYIDPDSIAVDYHPRVYLSDLSVENSHTWEAGTDPVVDADILPVLKPGAYPIGYPFSQSDYYQTPNVDYSADLTGGTLTATFQVSGQYMVRVSRTSGASQTYTVFAETGVLELPGSDDPTGPSRKISGPAGDVIVVAEGDATVDKAADNITNEGKNVKRANSVQGTINKIRDASQAAGRKVHVELVGHGAPGMISMNDKSVADGDLIGPDIEDIQAFQESIDAYCDDISLFSCRSAAGSEGDDLLQTLANSIGHASGWTKCITVADGYFTVETRAESQSVPSAGIPDAPKDFWLAQNYPNPFSPTTQIVYNLPADCRVRLEIHNVLGQKIRTLVDEHQQAGSQVARWDGRNSDGVAVSSGIYFCSIHAGSFMERRRMVLLR